MSMRNLLEMIHEYQTLVAKRDHLGLPLSEDETLRLLGLAQLLASEGDANGRAMPNVPLPASVVFTSPGGFEMGQVKNLSGRGLAIATSRPPEVDTRTVVRIVDTARGCEYLFPCRVAWRRQSPLPGMGVEFDGTPSRTRWAPNDETTGIWRRSPLGAGGSKDVQAA